MRPQVVVTRRKNALGLVGCAPVTKGNGGALVVHCTHRQYRVYRGRHMQTFAPVIARCRDDQHIVFGTEAYGFVKQWVRFTGWCQLTTTYVDDVCTQLHRLRDRALGQSGNRAQVHQLLYQQIRAKSVHGN